MQVLPELLKHLIPNPQAKRQRDMEELDGDTDYCEKHNCHYPRWSDCDQCEQEWLDGHDNSRTIKRLLGISVLVMLCVFIVVISILACFGH